MDDAVGWRFQGLDRSSLRLDWSGAVCMDCCFGLLLRLIHVFGLGPLMEGNLGNR